MSMQIELGIVAPEGLLTSTSSWPLVGKGGLPDRGAEIWDPRVQPESWGEGRLKDPGSGNLFFSNEAIPSLSRRSEYKLGCSGSMMVGTAGGSTSVPERYK